MTRHITPVLAGFLLAFATMTAAVRIGAASADPAPSPDIAHPVTVTPVVAHAHAHAPIEGMSAVALAVAPAAAPTSSPPVVTADQLHDPAVQPAEAWDDAKAARKLGWPVALLAALIMLARGIGTAGRNVPWLAWLNKGRAAVIVAGAGTVATAGFNTVGLGGTWFAVAMAAATALFALISPTSGQAPATSSTTTAATPTASALLLVLLVAGAGATLPACATLKADAKATGITAVSCVESDAPQAKALAYQLGTEALASVLAGNGIPWASLEAESEAAAKTQGIVVAACAFGPLVADLAKLLGVSAPAARAAAVAATQPEDPLAGGRVALARFKAALGVGAIQTTSGTL